MRFFYYLSLILLISQPSYAGMMEVSATGNWRTSKIDEDNYTKNESFTGSFAWYFLELSAIELSYTKGTAIQSLKLDSDPGPYVYTAEFEMYGADLVVTFAKRSSFIQPFVRGGMARVKKKIYREDPDGNVDRYGEAIDTTVPSYGFGVKINLTETFSLRGSYDRWRSGSNDDKEIWDDAIRAGVSWFF